MSFTKSWEPRLHCTTIGVVPLRFSVSKQVLLSYRDRDVHLVVYEPNSETCLGSEPKRGHHVHCPLPVPAVSWPDAAARRVEPGTPTLPDPALAPPTPLSCFYPSHPSHSPAVSIASPVGNACPRFVSTRIQVRRHPTNTSEELSPVQQDLFNQTRGNFNRVEATASACGWSFSLCRLRPRQRVFLSSGQRYRPANGDPPTARNPEAMHRT